MLRTVFKLAVVASAAALPCHAQAANWDEALQGEASGDRWAPTLPAPRPTGKPGTT